MRTTVTLESDVEQILRRRVRERGVSFKDALNDAVRDGVRSGGRPFRTEPARMGEPAVNLDRALQVVAELEDDELVRKSRLGSRYTSSTPTSCCTPSTATRRTTAGRSPGVNLGPR